MPHNLLRVETIASRWRRPAGTARLPLGSEGLLGRSSWIATGGPRDDRGSTAARDRRSPIPQKRATRQCPASANDVDKVRPGEGLVVQSSRYRYAGDRRYRVPDRALRAHAGRRLQRISARRRALRRSRALAIAQERPALQ